MAMMLFGGPGFIVSDISIATGGVIGAPVAFQYGLPAPRSGQTVESHLSRIHGVDLEYRGDFFLKANGDLLLTKGLGAFKANFARSLVTPKGALFWRKDYGIGLTEFLNKSRTAGNIHEMQNRIHVYLRSERAVEEITRNEVRVALEPGLIEVFVDLTVTGRPVHNALELRSV